MEERILEKAVLYAKDITSVVSGVVGGFVAMCFGGWTEALTTLCIFMVVDYMSGMAVAGIFKNSPKTETGGLESKAGFKGLCRKVFILLLVMLAYRIDLAMGTTYLMNATCIGFIVNELISIVENAGLMGLPMPAAITRAIDILTAKANGDEKNEL